MPICSLIDCRSHSLTFFSVTNFDTDCRCVQNVFIGGGIVARYVGYVCFGFFNCGRHRDWFTNLMPWEDDDEVAGQVSENEFMPNVPEFPQRFAPDFSTRSGEIGFVRSSPLNDNRRLSAPFDNIDTQMKTALACLVAGDSSVSSRTLAASFVLSKYQEAHGEAPDLSFICRTTWKASLRVCDVPMLNGLPMVRPSALFGRVYQRLVIAFLAAWGTGAADSQKFMRELGIKKPKVGCRKGSQR
jgi:hypothetical protein